MSTIDCPIRASARKAPASLALHADSGPITYERMDARISRCASLLRGQGVREGTRVGLLLRRDAESVSWLFALMRLGAVICPIGRRLPMAAVEEALLAIAADLLVSDRDVTVPIATLRADRAERAIPDSGREGEEPRWALDLPSTIVLTSGSVGRPRAVLHTLGNHYWSAIGAAANMPLAPGDRWLLPLPLSHVGGVAVAVRCVLAGAAVVFPADGETLPDAITRLRATHVSMVPTQLYRALEAGWRGGPWLRALLLGGAPAPERLLERGLAAGLPLHTSYGLTEMASQVTTTGPGATLEQLRTSGRVLPHRDLRISADGEILVRGATRFVGYVDGREVDEPFDEAGWFATADLGRFDPEGRLHVTGRRDNQFISGGENIQPEAIESVMLGVPGVRRAVVVAVPDEEFGARPVAFVDGAVSWEALAAAIAVRLPRFCVPRAFHRWPEDEPGGMKPSRVFLSRRARELAAADG